MAREGIRFSDEISRSDDSSELSNNTNNGTSTPKFHKTDRAFTAVFGNADGVEAEEMKYFCVTTGNNMETEADDEDDQTVLLRTFAGKKSRLIISTTREILLFKDGSFAYKGRKKSKKIKQTIKPKDIDKFVR